MSDGPPVRTHLGIDRRLVGEPLALEEGRAEAVLVTLPEMAADASGLVHGGFVFGLADYAAMLAVNDPNVVLAGAEVRFLKPVAAGERLLASARLAESSGRRRRVEVEVRRGDAGEAGQAGAGSPGAGQGVAAGSAGAGPVAAATAAMSVGTGPGAGMTSSGSAGAGPFAAATALSLPGEPVLTGTFHCAVPDRHVLAPASPPGETAALPAPARAEPGR